MSSNVAGLSTHGDGSESQPGCDLDGKSTGGWHYDDSKLYQAKSAIIDTISAFGSAEFALATYARVLLGQPCQTDNDCTAIVAGASCVDLPDDATTQKYCVQHMGADYTECSSGAPTCTDAPIRPTPMIASSSGASSTAALPAPTPSPVPGRRSSWVFPASGSNFPDIYHWIDGKEDLPPFTATSNREIRAEPPRLWRAACTRCATGCSTRIEPTSGRGRWVAVERSGCAIRVPPAGPTTSSWSPTGRTPARHPAATIP
jgi:hypothetical protein